MAPVVIVVLMKIKDYIVGNVKFLYYRAGQLWFQTENGFDFPVPIEDTGNATFNAEDKGIIFMRWIRKHLETIDNGRVA